MNKVQFTFNDFKAQLNQTSGNYVEMVPCLSTPEEMYYMICTHAICKDYFSDVIWAEKTKTKVDCQYGFSYTPDQYPIDTLDYINIAIWPRSNVLQAISFVEGYGANLQRFLDAWDSQMTHLIGDKRTEVRQCNEEDRLMVTFPSEYAKYPYLFSLELLFLRVGLLFEEKYTDIGVADYLDAFTELSSPFSTNDSGYVLSCLPAIKKIMKGQLIEKTWDSYKNQNGIHNNSGIMSVVEDYKQLTPSLELA